MQKFYNRVLPVAAITAVAASSAMAEATDIASTINELGTYKTSAMAIGIAVFLFVLGRKLVRKVS